MVNNINKDIWKEFNTLLDKYKLSHGVFYEHRKDKKHHNGTSMTITDKHIQINLIIPDYFEEG